MGELVYSKFNQPGYPSVVAVNNGSSVLTKVGGVRDGSCVVVDEGIITTVQRRMLSPASVLHGERGIT